MKENYWVWPAGTIPPDYCDHLIRTFDPQVAPATVDDSKVDETVRISQTCFINDIDVTSLMLDFSITANRNGFGVDTSPYIECQFTKYDGNRAEFYDWHMDAAVKGKLAFNRKISCVALLSDPKDFTGGEFEMHSIGEIPLEKGSVIAFPSFMVHRVKPVTSGTRFSLVSWQEGVDWR